jgi:hypothetical protein
MIASEGQTIMNDGRDESPFQFDAEAGERVPGLISKSAAVTHRRPAVIVVHGTGGNKFAMRPLLQKLAARGLIGVAIDARYAGDRAATGKGSDACRAAILETWRPIGWRACHASAFVRSSRPSSIHRHCDETAFNPEKRV